MKLIAEWDCPDCGRPWIAGRFGKHWHTWMGERCYGPGPRREPAQLVDYQAIAERLDVQVKTVYTWRERGLLPDPDVDSLKDPLWLWTTIHQWATATGRIE